MAYPPAPWTLRGYAVQTLQLVDTRRARQFVPSGLPIVSVLPGKTLGVVYLASYGPGSTLEYNELIIVPALTRYARKLGFWISHIYVDNPDSMIGGRELWGLPKEMAQFTWDRGEESQITVRQNGRLLCTMQYGRPRWLLPVPIYLPTFSRRDSNLLWFKGNITARMGIARGRWQVPDESPFAPLDLSRSGLTYHYQDMNFVASAPRVLAQSRATARA